MSLHWGRGRWNEEKGILEIFRRQNQQALVLCVQKIRSREETRVNPNFLLWSDTRMVVGTPVTMAKFYISKKMCTHTILRVYRSISGKHIETVESSRS